MSDQQMVEESPSEHLIDLSRLAAGIRWRRRLWMTMALVGVALGVVIATVLPARSTAAASIYVVHASESSGTGQMDTDKALLSTTTVAAEAVSRLKLDETPEKFVNTYSGTVVASGILEVTATADTPEEAVAHAQAVADAFIAVHVRQSGESAKAQVAAYNDLSTQVQRDLADVNAKIAAAAGTPAGAADVAALQNRRSSLLSQIASLDAQAQLASIGSPAVAAGTKVIDAAHVTSRSVLVSIALFGGFGLLIGWGLGIAIAAVASVARDRPILRRDIAAELGASVIAQLPAPVRGPLRRLRGARADKERRRAAATLLRAVRQDGAPVSVLELGCPEVAAGLAKDMADELAAERPVVVIDDLPGDELTRLLAGQDSAVELVAGADFPADPPVAPDGTARRIAVATVSHGAPWTDLRRLADEAFLVVRAGRVETSWMHTVARQLADAGIAIIGIVLVHPDPRDRSDGTLWDALHTAVRGRVAARPAPSTTEAVAQAAALAAVKALAKGASIVATPPATSAPPVMPVGPYGPRFAPPPAWPPVSAYRPPAPAQPQTPLHPLVESAPTEAIAMGATDDRTRVLPVTPPRPADAEPTPPAANGQAASPPPGVEETVVLPAQRRRNGAAENITNGAVSKGKNGKNGKNGVPVHESPAAADAQAPSTGPRDASMNVADDAAPRPDDPGRVRGRPAPRLRPAVRPVPLDGHPTVKLPPVVRSTPADRPEAT